MSAGRAGGPLVHVVLPNDIDDPAAPSGGNVYDRRVCDELARMGWSVREHPIFGNWPQPGPGQRDALTRTLAALPDGSLVLLDGLVGVPLPEVLSAQAHRLRLVMLAHLAFGHTNPRLRAGEREALTAAAAVVTTSAWTRDRLLALYGLPDELVQVAPPGVAPAPLAFGSNTGARLLCVASVAFHKGYDMMVSALDRLRDLSWQCVCIGALDREPAFTAQIRAEISRRGLAERISLVGPRVGGDLADSYAAADLLVLASRGETYGMVATEALARGIPVLATAVDGLPEAVGRAPDGSLPGLLVPPEDETAFAGALRSWLDAAALRDRLRRAARARRTALSGWGTTARQVSAALTTVASTVGVAR